MADGIDLTIAFPEVALDAWRAKVRADLRGRDAESLSKPSLDGVEIEPLYTATSAERGLPGAPPFVRAAKAERPWLVVHELTGDLESAKRALAEGADAIWVPCGAAIEKSSTSTITSTSTALFVEVSEPEAGALCDPLASLARGPGYAIEPRMAALAAVIEKSDPSARPILVSGVTFHEAGAGAVDELGLTIASGVEYLRQLSEAGAALADLPRRMLFALAVDSDFFVGIAKLRAARLLWSKVLRTLGIDGGEQGMMIHARASRRALSALDAHTNVLRGTASALAGILGGAELVSIAPYDVVLGTQNALAEHLARNTQLVLREEGHLGRVIDPAGGSYFLEALTEKLARRAWGVLQEVEHLGGVARGLRDGSIAERVARAAEERRRAFAHGERTMVGVNRYPAKETISAGEAAARGALAPMRDAEPFEALRARAAGARAAIVAVGDARTLKARIDFAREALEIAGIEITLVGPVADAKAVGKIEPRAVVVCAADEDYPAVLGALALEGKHVVVAGKPREDLARADGFLHLGADRIEVLSALAKGATS